MFVGHPDFSCFTKISKSKAAGIKVWQLEIPQDSGGLSKLDLSFARERLH